MGVDKRTIEAFVINHQNDNAIDQILNMTCVKALPEGENYTSVIWRVTCDVILKSGRQARRHLIVKEAITEGNHGMMLTEHGLFRREIEAYQNILKQMENIMETICDHRETQWPELIGFRSNDLVVLTDLSVTGYKTVNRKEMLDLAHSLLLVRELGRFHAMGLALLEKGVVNRNSFTLYELGQKELFQMLFMTALTAFSETVEAAWGSDWKEASRRIKLSLGWAYEKFSKMIQIDPNRFNVINHGDCWTNNIMFKYDDSQRPIRVKFLDFQIVHYNSFAVDLTYLIYNSIQGEVRRSHYDEIIRAYRNSVEHNMRLFGIDSTLPKLEEMKEEMSRFQFFAYLLLCSVHAVTSAEVKPVDMEKLSDKNSDGSKSFNQEVFTSEKFKNNVGKDLIAFMEAGVI